MPLVDLDRWPRRPIHDFFLGFADPWFNLTAEVEVAATRAWCREAGAPFSLAVWFAVLDAAHAEPALRQRLRPEGVWEHPRVRLGATALRPDQTFTYVTFPDAPDWPRWSAGAEAALATGLATPGLRPAEGDDLLYGTVVPWVRFTGIKHARAGDPLDAVPRIAIGRATPEGARVRLPVSVEGHHALVDGVHVGRFLERLEGALARPEATFAAR